MMMDARPVRLLAVAGLLVCVMSSWWWIGNHAVLAEGRTFTVVNKCEETIWLGVYGSFVVQVSEGAAALVLQPQQATQMQVGEGWMGRLWGRTGCSFDDAGEGSCATGDCGGTLVCRQTGDPPASLAEFNIQQHSDDFYDISLVDGYNLEMSVVPSGAAQQSSAGNCSATGCVSDLNTFCPPELQLLSHNNPDYVIACKSACDAFNLPQYCCTGSHSTPQTCPPTNYSLLFKQACPTAYSYAYDDPSSTFTCAGGADYTLTFCN